MKMLIAVPALMAAGCLMLAAPAGAQVVVPPGQDFYATPVSKDGMSVMEPGRIVTEAPPAKKSKRRVMKRKAKQG